MQYVLGYLILSKRSLSSDCTNINILASFFFSTPLCYFGKQIPLSSIMFGNVTYTERNRLILHAKLML